MAHPKNQKQNHPPQSHGPLPVRLYLKIFFALLAMIFINMGIAHMPWPDEVITWSLIVVAFIQAILVAVFFMELIHEDKFFSFVFGSAVLFMFLFFLVSLLEIRTRDRFDRSEGTKFMRQVDQGGNFAPGGPRIQKEPTEKKK